MYIGKSMYKKILLIISVLFLSACGKTVEEAPVAPEEVPEVVEKYPELKFSPGDFLTKVNSTVFTIGDENTVVDTHYGENEFFFTTNYLNEENSASFVTDEIFRVKVNDSTDPLQLESIYKFDEVARVFDIHQFQDSIYVSIIENRSESGLSKHKVVRLTDSGYDVLYEVTVDWPYDSPSYYVANNKLYMTSLSVAIENNRYIQEYKLLVLDGDEFVTVGSNLCEGSSYEECYRYQSYSSSFEDGFIITQHSLVDENDVLIWEVDKEGALTKYNFDEFTHGFAYVKDLDVHLAATKKGISIIEKTGKKHLIFKSDNHNYPLLVDGTDVHGIFQSSYATMSKIDLKNMTIAHQTAEPEIKSPVWPQWLIKEDKIYVSLHNDYQVQIIEYEK